MDAQNKNIIQMYMTQYFYLSKKLLQIVFVIVGVSVFLSGARIAFASDEYTKLLLHGDGNDGSTSIVDTSMSSHAVSVVGNAQIDTSYSKFGGSSIYFDSSVNGLAIASHPDFAFGAGDFTIDFWLRPAAFNDTYDRYITSPDGWFTLARWRSGLNGGKIYFQSAAGQWTTSWAPNVLGVWRHVAVVRKSGFVTVYINGSSVGTFNANVNIGQSGLHIGYSSGYPHTDEASIQGHLDEIRISKGIARWTSNFTPPTAPYEDYASTTTPISTTQAPTSITPTTATANATITDTGGDDPERLIEWGTVSGTYTDQCSAGTGGTGTYSCNMTNLQPETTYYVRAKATNSAGTSYGSETSFTTLGDTTIQNPTPTKIQTAVSEGYITLDNGTIDNTTSTTTQVNVTLTQNGKEVIFPTNTTITEQSAGSFNFQNFTLEEQDIKDQQPNSRKAFRLGIQGEKLNFSQNITVNAYVGEAFNNQELDILYQQEGESTWQTQGTCTVTNGTCSFQTDHATIYTINGNLQATGNAPLNINTEVKDTLTLDCYDSTQGTGNYDVTLGTTSNPGFVTAGTPAVGTSTCDTTTNDDQGYYLTVENDNGVAYTTLTHTDPNTSTIYEIQDLTPWNETTKTTEHWNTPTTKGLGFSVITFPDTDTANNTFDGVWNDTNQCPEGTNTDTNNYAGIPDTPEAIAAVPEYNATQTTTEICYKVDVPASQPSGIYTGSVTYTATSDASSYLN